MVIIVDNNISLYLFLLKILCFYCIFIDLSFLFLFTLTLFSLLNNFFVYIYNNFNNLSVFGFII
jgi:uncharacterized membrane protein